MLVSIHRIVEITERLEVLCCSLVETQLHQAKEPAQPILQHLPQMTSIQAISSYYINHSTMNTCIKMKDASAPRVAALPLRHISQLTAPLLPRIHVASAN